MEKVKIAYTGDDPGMLEKLDEAIQRNELHAEVIARDAVASKLTRRFETRSPAKGAAGIQTMMTLGALADDRVLPIGPRPTREQAKFIGELARKKEVSKRARNKKAAASRRKNRRR